MHFFAEKKYSDKEDLQENPFFQFNPSFGYRKLNFEFNDDANREYKDWLFNENHNEYENGQTKFGKQNHCILLHELYDHTILSWQDIVDIEDIWFEINIKVQNFSSNK